MILLTKRKHFVILVVRKKIDVIPNVARYSHNHNHAITMQVFKLHFGWQRKKMITLLTPIRYQRLTSCSNVWGLGNSAANSFFRPSSILGVSFPTFAGISSVPCSAPFRPWGNRSFIRLIT